MDLYEALKKYHEAGKRFNAEMKPYLEFIVAELEKIVYGMMQLLEEDPSLEKSLPMDELDSMLQLYESFVSTLMNNDSTLEKLAMLIESLNQRFPNLEDKSRQYLEFLKKAEEDFIEMMKKARSQSPVPDDQPPKDVLDMELDDMEGKDPGEPSDAPVHDDLDDLWDDEFGDDKKEPDKDGPDGDPKDEQPEDEESDEDDPEDKPDEPKK